MHLKDLQLEHVWESEKIGREKDFYKLVRDLIAEKEKWSEKASKKEKLRNYIKIKNSLGLEDYVVELDREEDSSQ